MYGKVHGKFCNQRKGNKFVKNLSMLDSAECMNKISIFKYIKFYVWNFFYKNMTNFVIFL